MRPSSKTFLIENRHYMDEIRQAPTVDPNEDRNKPSRFGHIPIKEFLQISQVDFNEPSAVDINDRQSIFLFLVRLYNKFDAWSAGHAGNIEYLKTHRHVLKNAEQGSIRGAGIAQNFRKIIVAEFIPSYGTVNESDFDSVFKLLKDCYREFDKLEAVAA